MEFGEVLGGEGDAEAAPASVLQAAERLVKAFTETRWTTLRSQPPAYPF
ncbi:MULTISPECIES: hypothetical protein [unclassified Kribbella]